MQEDLSIMDVQKLKGNTVLSCLANGLSIEDALILAEWSEEDFEAYKKANSRFAQVVERKKVEYKQMLMTPITESIKKGDSKMAQWMLERQFQSQFSNKTRKDQEEKNPISVIINNIQAGTPTTLPRSRVMKKLKAELEESTQIYESKRGDQSEEE